MRILLFFDLPMSSKSELREYRHFRTQLLRDGFLMLQESVYAKLVLNGTAAQSVIQKIKSYHPHRGCIQILVVTEKQFARMEYIIGQPSHTLVDTFEKVLVI